MLDISIQNNKTPHRGNSRLCSINRKKRLSQAKIMFIDEPYSKYNRKGFGMYLIADNLFNEKFKLNELLSNKQITFNK